MTTQFIILIILFFSHFIGDFLCQSREMGRKKSKEFYWWAWHVFYIFIWTYLPLEFYFNHNFIPKDSELIWIPLQMSLFIAGIHGLVDACSWNIYGWFVKRNFKAEVREQYEALDEKPKGIDLDEVVRTRLNNFKYWEDHWFYVTIGADQLAHILTIVFAVIIFL